MKRASVSSLVGYRSKDEDACSTGGFWCLVLGCVALKRSVLVFPARLNLPKGTKLFRQQLSVGHQPAPLAARVVGKHPIHTSETKANCYISHAPVSSASVFFKKQSHELGPPSGFRFPVHPDIPQDVGVRRCPDPALIIENPACDIESLSALLTSTPRKTQTSPEQEN